jgi:hypothetical protein
MEEDNIERMRHQEMLRQKSFMEKAASYAASIASRGVTNKKVNDETKQLRMLSCHGDETLGPCPHRMQSQKFDNSFYCGGCGCGDKQSTQLINLTINQKENYGKLDYPKVWCPLEMPGFQPYKPSNEETADIQNSRKIEIENRLSVEYITEKSKHGEPTQ